MLWVLWLTFYRTTASLQVAHQKEEEVKMLKMHAKTILTQRSEVEQYFLESINQCETKLRKLKMLEHKHGKKVHNRSILSLAGKRDGHFLLPQLHSNPADQMDQAMYEKALKEEAEELVPGLDRLQLLRLLYSKINNAPAVKQARMPAHSFGMSVYTYAVGMCIHAYFWVSSFLIKSTKVDIPGSLWHCPSSSDIQIAPELFRPSSNDSMVL